MASPTTCPWWTMPETCTHCAAGDGEAEGRRVLVLCSACFAAGTHTGCHHDVTGEPLPPEITHGDGLYFCSQECQRSYEALEAATNRRVKIRDEPEQYTFEIIKYSKTDRTVRSAVETSMRMFRSSFAPLIMENGRDLLEMVCTAYETPDEEVDEEEGGGHNFSAFRLAILRMGGTIITAATLRVFGCKFAEMPFVSTREGHRWAGNCKRLMKAVEDLLLSGGVTCLVIPSINELLPMWTRKFGFNKLADQEVEGIEDWIVDTDRETCTLVRKHILPPGQPQPQPPPQPPVRRTASLPAPATASGATAGGALAGRLPAAAGMVSGTASRGPCSIMAGIPGSGTAPLPRKRFRAPKMVLTRQASDSDESEADSGSESSGSDGSQCHGRGRGRGGRGKANSKGRSNSGKKSGRGRKHSSRSDSESDFVPHKDDVAKDKASDDSGADEELVPEEPLATSGRAKKRGKSAAAAPSGSAGNGAATDAGASGQEDAAAKAPKPKRARRVGPRAPRGPPPPPMRAPPHPIFTSDVTFIRVPTEVEPAPPPLPRELDVGRPPLSDQPFELSIHLQAYLIEKAEREAKLAEKNAAAGQPTTTAAQVAAPAVVAANAAPVTAGAAPTTTAAPATIATTGAAVTAGAGPTTAAVPAADNTTGAAAPPPSTGIATPNAAGPQLPPRPPLPRPPQQQPRQQPQQHQGQDKRQRPAQQQGQQRAAARNHRAARKQRTPEQEAARQRRLRLRKVARKRRREYRDMMMGFTIAEMVHQALLMEEPRPFASNADVDTDACVDKVTGVDNNESYKSRFQRVQADNEELRRVNQQLADELAQAQAGLRAAQEQVQLLSSRLQQQQQPSAQQVSDSVASPESTLSPLFPRKMHGAGSGLQAADAASPSSDEPLAPTPLPGQRPLPEDVSPAAVATATAILTPATVHASRIPQASPCQLPYALPYGSPRSSPCLDLRGAINRELSFPPVSVIADAAVSVPDCVVDSVTTAPDHDGGVLFEQPDMFGSPLELQPSLRQVDCTSTCPVLAATLQVNGDVKEAAKLPVDGTEALAEVAHIEEAGSGAARPRMEVEAGNNHNGSSHDSSHQRESSPFHLSENSKSPQGLHVQSGFASGHSSPSPAGADAPAGPSAPVLLVPRDLRTCVGGSGGGEAKSPASGGMRSPLSSLIRSNPCGVLSLMVQRLAEDTPRPRRPGNESPRRGSPLKLPPCPISLQPQPQVQPFGANTGCEGPGDAARIISSLPVVAEGVSPNGSNDTRSTKRRIVTLPAAADRTGCSFIAPDTTKLAAATAIAAETAAVANGGHPLAAAATSSVGVNKGDSSAGSWNTVAGMEAAPGGGTGSLVDSTMLEAPEQLMSLMDTSSVSPAAVRLAVGVTDVARPPRPPMQSPPATSRSPMGVAGTQGYPAAMLTAYMLSIPGSPAGSAEAPAGTEHRPRGIAQDAQVADGSGFGRIAVSGLLGGCSNRISGRDAAVSPESLRRFETQCLLPLLPHVVSVLLADTPPSRSPTRRRTSPDILAEGDAGAGQRRDDDADRSGVSGDEGGAVRALMFDSVMDEAQPIARDVPCCTGATANPKFSSTSALTTADSASAAAFVNVTIPSPVAAPAVSDTFTAVHQIAEGTSLQVGGSVVGKSGSSRVADTGFDRPTPDAVLGTRQTGSMEGLSMDDSRHFKRLRVAGISGSQSDSDGGGCGSAQHDAAASPRHEAQDCRLGVSTAFATRVQSPAVGFDMESTMTLVQSTAGVVVSGLSGEPRRAVSPVLASNSAVRLGVYDSPAPGRLKRGRLFMLAAGSGDVVRPAAVDPYDAVLCDIDTVSGAAEKGLAAGATGGGRAPDADVNRNPTSPAVSTDSSPDKMETAVVRRRRAAKRLNRRKKTAMDVFGEDVVLSSSAPSDSPGSTPPSSDPPTPEDGRTAGGVMVGQSMAAGASGSSNVAAVPAPAAKVAAAKSLLLPLAAATGVGSQEGSGAAAEVLRVQTAGRSQTALPSVSSILETRGIVNSLFGQRGTAPEAPTRREATSDAADAETRGLLWIGDDGATGAEGVAPLSMRAAASGANGRVGRTASTPRPLRGQRNGGDGADSDGGNSPLNDGDCATLLGAGGSASPLSASASAYLDEPLRLMFQDISADMAANQYGKELSAAYLFEEGKEPQADGNEANGPAATVREGRQPQSHPSPRPLQLPEHVLRALDDASRPPVEAGCLVADVASESVVYENVGEAMQGVTSLVGVLADD